MLWNAAWYLSSGYERNDPRGPESRVYGVVWEIATVQQCLFHAGSTRKHRGKGCRNLFLKELGTDSFRSALSHTYCTQSPLYFLSLSLSVCLSFSDSSKRSKERQIWLKFSFEEIEDFVEIRNPWRVWERDCFIIFFFRKKALFF